MGGEVISRTMDFTVCLGPFHFSWIVTCLEMTMAFGAAETEDLGVVADEHESMPGVHGTRAEVAFVDSHLIITVVGIKRFMDMFKFL